MKTAFISKSSIAHNLGEIRKLTSSEILAMVKADAYGHDVHIVVPTLLDLGIKRFGVATLQEALTVSRLGAKWILIMGTTDHYEPDVLDELALKGIRIVINNEEFGRFILANTKKLKAHLMIDTGMHRHGILHSNIDSIKKLLTTFPGRIEGILTHFAKADSDEEVTRTQINRFMAVLNEIPRDDLIVHAANSSALYKYPEVHFDMVRPGVAIYGYSEVPEFDTKLKRVMRVEATVSDIREIPPGEGVSYGWRFIADKPTKVATVSMGYADGYKRILSGKVWAGIKGKTARQIGSIAMDFSMFDITDIEGVKVGDKVVIMGDWEEGSIWADDIANLAGTIPYEILVSFGKRVERKEIE
ncbi:MAG: alanine racemase [Dictyoglomi bacterium]|nr:alanine racemase [Dictyoglomota bacterium]